MIDPVLDLGVFRGGPAAEEMVHVVVDDGEAPLLGCSRYPEMGCEGVEDGLIDALPRFLGRLLTAT